MIYQMYTAQRPEYEELLKDLNRSSSDDSSSSDDKEPVATLDRTISFPARVLHRIVREHEQKKRREQQSSSSGNNAMNRQSFSLSSPQIMAQGTATIGPTVIGTGGIGGITGGSTLLQSLLSTAATPTHVQTPTPTTPANTLVRHSSISTSGFMRSALISPMQQRDDAMSIESGSESGERRSGRTPKREPPKFIISHVDRYGNRKRGRPAKKPYCAECNKDTQVFEMVQCQKCLLITHTFCHVPDLKHLKDEHRRNWVCPECKVCEVCDTEGDPEKVLICEACDQAYHTYCLDPPLKSVPTDLWVCPRCRGLPVVKKSPPPQTQTTSDETQQQGTEDDKDEDDNDASAYETRASHRKRMRL